MKKKRVNKTSGHEGGITVYLGPELNQQVDRIKERRGITKTFMVKQALTDWIANNSEFEE